MSVSSVLIGLQASRPDGRGVTSGEFLAPLNVRSDEVEEVRTDGGDWAAGMITFKTVRSSEFSDSDTSIDAGAASEGFFAATIEAFRIAGRFLDLRDPDVTTQIRASGISLRLFVALRMDQDQMELQFPPGLLSACARHRLDVYVISNDD